MMEVAKENGSIVKLRMPSWWEVIKTIAFVGFSAGIFIFTLKLNETVNSAKESIKAEVRQEIQQHQLEAATNYVRKETWEEHDKYQAKQLDEIKQELRDIKIMLQAVHDKPK